MKKSETEKETGNDFESSNEKPRIIRIMNFLKQRYELRVNEVSQEIECKQNKSLNAFAEINQSDLIFELYEAGFTGFKDEFNTLFSSTKISRYDPFLEYFDGLQKWEKSDPDYISELAEYVETDNQKWWKWMFKKHLVRMAGQATGKISFNKHCLTLIGGQNPGKTTFLEFLVPPILGCYKKKGFDFKSKDGLISLIQNFLINLDELGSFDKRELNKFKSIISESGVRYRPLFANYETTIMRRASFVATTNHIEFLTDETGNVRWIPFVVHSVKHDNGGAKGYQKNIDINKVWAQAYTLLKGDFKSYLTAEEVEHQEDFNKRFMKITDEMDVVSRFLRPSKKGNINAEFLSSTEISEYFRTKATTKLYSIPLGKALVTMGFEKLSGYDREKGSRKGYYVEKIKEPSYLLT